MEQSNFKALFIIANAGFADEVIQIAREVGVTGATIIKARGEGAHFESFLGITVDTEKELVFCVTTQAIAEAAMEAIKAKAGIKSPAHSLCFTMPVEKTVGINREA